ncbi:MAG: hypothetical protein WA906_07965 [Pacificimonas sp.]
MTPNVQGNKVASLPPATRSTVVSDELARLTDLLRDAFPNARNIGFEYQGALNVHIDLQTREHMMLVEERLPYLGGGSLFSSPRRTSAPKQPFLHRITAVVTG